jgi:hypothetical protein
MVQGRKPDEARRARMILLRAEGLTFAEIGRRLGVSKQSVQLTLKAAGKAALTTPIQCRQCARRIGVRPYRGLAATRVLCLRCVREPPKRVAIVPPPAVRFRHGLQHMQADLQGLQFSSGLWIMNSAVGSIVLALARPWRRLNLWDNISEVSAHSSI